MNEFESLLRDWTKQDPFYRRILGRASGHHRESVLQARAKGFLAGIPFAHKTAKILGLEANWKKASGDSIRKGEEIARFYGRVESILKFENLVIGLIGKPSGIATAAREASRRAGGRIRIVSGGWKKHPILIKEIVQEAVVAGGLSTRIIEGPFLYLDKNYVRLFGGVGKTLTALVDDPTVKVIQVRGEFASIDREAREAIRNGAKVIMVDTGSWRDLETVLRVMKKEKASSRVNIAFAGGIQIRDIAALIKKGVDILDIGSSILDAPWLELSYDITLTR